MGKIVTIDGPAGSGKSTTAIALAKKLGFVYLDTGAMYRAITLKFLTLEIKSLTDDGVVDDVLKSTVIEIEPDKDNLKISLDGEDVTSQIRSDRIESFVSEVAAIKAVREYMHKQQRRLAGKYDIVAEGRDLGTYVFPHADVKIYLIADLDIRAGRRMLQKQAPAEDLDKYRRNLIKRDRIDSSRDHSPLKKAADAIEIDTSRLTVEQQVQKIYDICRKKIK
jgi:cytidylate kinase